MIDEIAATGTSRRNSSVSVGPSVAAGFLLSKRLVIESSAPVARTAPATTYRAAMVITASFEKPESAWVVVITPGATRAATAVIIAMGADTRSLASTATTAITTASVYQACQAMRQLAGVGSVAMGSRKPSRSRYATMLSAHSSGP